MPHHCIIDVEEIKQMTQDDINKIAWSVDVHSVGGKYYLVIHAGLYGYSDCGPYATEEEAMANVEEEKHWLEMLLK